MSLLPSLVPAGDLPRVQRPPRTRARHREPGRAVRGRPARPASVADLGLCAGGRWARPLALACILALPKAPRRRPATSGPRLPAAIQAGARFVVHHELLRGISLCAIFWNFAFFALLAIWAPLALGPLKLDPASMGLAQSAYGAGLILGALVAPVSSRRLPPLATLIFGPAVSVIAAALFLLAPPRGNGFAFAAAGHFLVGFGPMLWLICQTTVRQLVTPAPLLGRVNATVQTAIYGVRPLGALAGGIVAAQAGLQAALLLIAASFVLSTLVIVLSPLARLRALPQPAAA